MRMLVTGAAGFIGSHLCQALLHRGHDVAGLDDLSTGRLENVGGVSGDPRFRLVRGSVLDKAAVNELTDGADWVFHLAAAAGENVMAAAHRSRARLLMAPASDESLAGGYVRRRGLRATTARLFSIAGPRQSGRYGMVIPRFVRQALRGDPLTVFGSGKQVRCFCHVLDVVPALIRLAAADSACGRAVDLGGTEQVPIEELARRVIAATGSPSTIRNIPYQAAGRADYEDMQHRVPDGTLAWELVGFRARRSLDEIIQDVVTEQAAVAPVVAGAAS